MTRPASVARKIAVGLGLAFLLLGSFVAMVVNHDVSRVQLLMMLVFGAGVAGLLSHLARRTKTQLDERGLPVREGLERLAHTFFDSPVELAAGYDTSVTTPPATIDQGDVDVGWTAEGTCGGTRVAIASHVSTAARELGESWHTHSYVCVDLEGLDVWFYLTKPVDDLLGVGTVKNEAKVGDPDFDDAWDIRAKEDVARAVLDDSVRARISALRRATAGVSQYPGAMTILASRHGLALRWPGELTTERAAFIRDLLLDMRKNILLHASRQAAHGGPAAEAQGGYRIAAQPEVPPAEDDADEDDAEKRARA